MGNNPGYDDGYRSCPCFWGDKPGSLVTVLERFRTFEGVRALDIGCGEGKNSFYIAQAGGWVTANDYSESAIRNALSKFSHPSISYSVADARKIDLADDSYDVVIAYGLLHCLNNAAEIIDVILKIKAATALGGYLILCAFNDRDHDLSAHPGFSPILLPHSFYVDMLSEWELLFCTDETLHEVHPHNNIPHHHSLTRMICRRNK